MVKEDKERSKASALLSSESSMDDIRRLWTRTIDQSIKGHASLMGAYRIQVLPLPAYCPPTEPLHTIPPLPVKLLACSPAIFSPQRMPYCTATLACGMFFTRRDLISITQSLHAPA